MIEFQQVCRSYGDKVAVDNLNLRVAAGELYSLLGHNGAGKTTAIKMLVGLIRPGQRHDPRRRLRRRHADARRPRR